MARRSWVELDRKAVGELLKSPEMGAAMKEQADKIAANAGDVTVVVDYTRRRTRVVAKVLSTLENERKTGGLARAMGKAGM